MKWPPSVHTAVVGVTRGRAGVEASRAECRVTNVLRVWMRIGWRRVCAGSKDAKARPCGLFADPALSGDPTG